MSILLHVDYLVRDMDRSLQFYTRHFGCIVLEDAVVEGAVVEFCSRGSAKSARIVMLQFPGTAGSDTGTMLELVELDPQTEQEIHFGSAGDWLPSLANVTILVEDLEALLAKLGAAGIEPISSILSITLPRLGSCRMAFIRDPDENLIELAERGESVLI